MPDVTVRGEIVANALWGAANEREIHYSQGSHRFDALRTPRYLPLYTDCSAFVTLCYAWAGAPDPNGLDYNGSGFTGTLLGHLPQIPLADAQPGDLIVYGPSTGDHVVVIVEPGPDPMTVSHGQEAGPVRVRHSIEARYHRGPVRVLKGLADVPAPTPTPQPQPEDEVTFTYAYRDGGGPIAAVFDTGSVRGVKYFDDFEELFIDTLGAKRVDYLVPPPPGGQPATDDLPDDRGATRKVWRLDKDVADALGLPK